MKIKEGFILRKVGIQYVVAAVGAAAECFDGMLRLNETGAFLFETLSGECTEADLVKALLENYEVDEQTAGNGVKKFLASIREVNALEA